MLCLNINDNDNDDDFDICYQLMISVANVGEKMMMMADNDIGDVDGNDDNEGTDVFCVSRRNILCLRLNRAPYCGSKLTILCALKYLGC